MADAGLVVITAFISPYRSDRQYAREIALQANVDFIEVFVDAPIAVCEARDPKGLYRQARAGEIQEFTGVSAPYEVPQDPDLVISTADSSVRAATESLLSAVLQRLHKNGAPPPVEATPRHEERALKRAG